MTSTTRARWAPLLAVLLTAALALAGCGGTATGKEDAGSHVGSVELAKVTLKVGDQKGGSKSLLPPPGCSTTCRTRSSGRRSRPARRCWRRFRRRHPPRRVGNTPPIFAAAAKAKITAVCQLEGRRRGDAILVRPDSPSRAVNELKGKTIGGGQGQLRARSGPASRCGRPGCHEGREGRSCSPPTRYGGVQPAAGSTLGGLGPLHLAGELESEARVIADGQGTVNGYDFMVAAARRWTTRRTRRSATTCAPRQGQRWADTHREEWAQAWAQETGLDIEVARRRRRGGPGPSRCRWTTRSSRPNRSWRTRSPRTASLPGKVDFADVRRPPLHQRPRARA